RAAGQCVQHVVQAGSAAQAVVGTARVEQQAVRHRGTELAQGVSRCIDHKQAQTLFVLRPGLLKQCVRVVRTGTREAVAVF
nr:hypothetical protein [Tanacetum cinerariifolium]